MQHAIWPVDILDEQGRIAGQKPRNEVNKGMDIFHGVHVVLITPAGQVVLSVIAQRDDLPNRYAGMLGSTMATIRRSSESAKDAAWRGLRRELLLEKGKLRLLHDGFVKLSDGRPNYLTAYCLKAAIPELYRNLESGELMMIEPDGVEVAMEIHADRFAPTLQAIWPSIWQLYNPKTN